MILYIKYKQIMLKYKLQTNETQIQNPEDILITLKDEQMASPE